MKIGIALALAAALTLSGCGDSEPATEIVSDRIPVQDAETVTRAIAIFAKVCPDLFDRYWPDVIEARASIMDNYPDEVMALPYYERYGWRKNVLLEIKLREDLRVIPTKFRAWGHTLFYYLGGGRLPGVMTGKRQAKSVCGFTALTDDDERVPVPALALVDELN